MTDTIIGWDIGGANIKLAIVEDGVVRRVVQTPCPAIQDKAKFNRAIEAAMAYVPEGARHAVTITGELSDVFANRAEGVAYISQTLQRTLSSWPGLSRPSTASCPAIYAGRWGFLPPEEAPARWSDIASANWHATATLVGCFSPDALLIDIGTTTTDIIPIRDGQCAARGYTDAARLTTGELVYTGVVRTPVMAVARHAPFAGREQGLAAERFATMADAYRLTGDLAEASDDHPTPDGAGKSIEENAARLARMTGRDLADAPITDWISLASFLAEQQLGEIQTAAQLVSLTAQPVPIPAEEREPELRHPWQQRARKKTESGPTPSPLKGEGWGEGIRTIIGAGCGRFLAQRLAKRLGYAYMEFPELIKCLDDTREMAAVCAPAVSVALLLEKTYRASAK